MTLMTLRLASIELETGRPASTEHIDTDLVRWLVEAEHGQPRRPVRPVPSHLLLTGEDPMEDLPSREPSRIPDKCDPWGLRHERRVRGKDRVFHKAKAKAKAARHDSTLLA